jgi:hypothetical protein
VALARYACQEHSRGTGLAPTEASAPVLGCAGVPDGQAAPCQVVRPSLDQKRREELGQQARKASRGGPTHAHPGKPPANERSTITKVASGLYDRLHDMAEHPEEAVETGGEQGP